MVNNHSLFMHSTTPLGVNLKGKNINGEIMETLHQYVPTKSVGSSREFVEKYVSVWW